MHQLQEKSWQLKIVSKHTSCTGFKVRLLSKRPSQTRFEWDLESLGNERVHEELFGSRTV